MTRIDSRAKVNNPPKKMGRKNDFVGESGFPRMKNEQKEKTEACSWEAESSQKNTSKW